MLYRYIYPYQIYQSKNLPMTAQDCPLFRGQSFFYVQKRSNMAFKALISMLIQVNRWTEQIQPNTAERESIHLHGQYAIIGRLHSDFKHGKITPSLYAAFEGINS